MDKKKTKLLFKHNSYDILEDGEYVICAVSGKNYAKQSQVLERRATRSLFFSRRGRQKI